MIAVLLILLDTPSFKISDITLLKVMAALTGGDVRDAFCEALSRSGIDKGNPGLTVFVGGSSGQDVVRWIEDFETRTRAHRWDDITRFRKLPLFMGGVANDWYNIYITHGGDSAPTTWEAVKRLMIDHFKPSDYSAYLRDELNKRVQYQNESVTDYIITKRSLCLRFNSEMNEDEVVDRIIKGLDPDIAQHVFAHEPENFQSLLDLGKRLEQGRNLYRNKGKCMNVVEDKSDIKELTQVLKEMAQNHRDEMNSLREELRSIKLDKKEEKVKSAQYRSTDFNRDRNFYGKPRCFNWR